MALAQGPFLPFCFFCCYCNSLNSTPCDLQLIYKEETQNSPPGRQERLSIPSACTKGNVHTSEKRKANHYEWMPPIWLRRCCISSPLNISADSVTFPIMQALTFYRWRIFYLSPARPAPFQSLRVSTLIKQPKLTHSNACIDASMHARNWRYNCSTPHSGMRRCSRSSCGAVSMQAACRNMGEFQAGCSGWWY